MVERSLSRVGLLQLKKKAEIQYATEKLMRKAVQIIYADTMPVAKFHVAEFNKDVKKFNQWFGEMEE